MVTRVPRSEPGAAARGANGGRRPRGVDAPWAELRRAWRAFGSRLPRLRAEAARFAATRVDLVRLAAAQKASGIFAGLLTFVAIVAVLVMGAVLTMLGVAGGVAQALDGNAWAGNLVTGAGVLVLLAAYLAMRSSSRRAARLRRLHDRYARFDRASSDRDSAADTSEGVPHEPRS